ncbi:hypothetical protein EJ06DRAFT_529014 [Trichodelitschia bisporula]|uniref:Uncharacterized protein n=1 Tax=Trichodelitschia bisporula TaxID=703511 RepID=A0A6G1I0Q5_9PEZI|nr:hypothetical protein EJ06DRAFT_529014 [Trichodelitschia bisporula]
MSSHRRCLLAACGNSRAAAEFNSDKHASIDARSQPPDLPQHLELRTPLKLRSPASFIDDPDSLFPYHFSSSAFRNRMLPLLKPLVNAFGYRKLPLRRRCILHLSTVTCKSNRTVYGCTPGKWHRLLGHTPTCAMTLLYKTWNWTRWKGGKGGGLYGCMPSRTRETELPLKLFC